MPCPQLLQPESAPFPFPPVWWLDDPKAVPSFSDLLFQSPSVFRQQEGVGHDQAKAWKKKVKVYLSLLFCFYLGCFSCILAIPAQSLSFLMDANHQKGVGSTFLPGERWQGQELDKRTVVAVLPLRRICSPVTPVLKTVKMMMFMAFC